MSAHRRLLYAHRGAAAEQPENTLPSFHRALELGADALEMDAHMTRDGHVVICHDPNGARTCGVAAPIRSCSLAEVQSWDAGYGFVDADGQRPFAGRGIRIPTLDEVLAAFPLTPINIDLKQRRPSLVGAALELLRRRRAEDRVCLASFHASTLLRVRAAGYRGKTAVAREELISCLLAPAPLWRCLPFRGAAAQIPVRQGPIELGRRGVIDRLHAAGLRVDFWTVNEPAEARRLLELGADGIMTDDPRAIAPVVAAAA